MKTGKRLLKRYCKGLPLPGERKCIEPMAARLYPADIQSRISSSCHPVHRRLRAPGLEPYRRTIFGEG